MAPQDTTALALQHHLVLQRRYPHAHDKSITVYDFSRGGQIVATCNRAADGLLGEIAWLDGSAGS